MNKKNKKIHKKPTGVDGIIRISISSSGHQVLKFKKKLWPKSKDEQEKIVVNRFIKASKKAGFVIHSCKQNEESHFDFTLVVGNKETVYLDLKEIVVSIEHGSPYNQENRMLNAGEYSDYIIKLIKKYSDHYQSKSKIPIHLLLYFTDWKFTLNDVVIAIIQHSLLQEKLAFEYIFLLNMISNDHEELRLLFPSKNNHLTNFNHDKYKQSLVFNLDPKKWELI